jgi:hypothetical protein
LIEGKRKQCQYEIDFVVNVGSEKVYIQSAFGHAGKEVAGDLLAP